MCRQCTLFPPRPKPRGKAPAGNVVATDPASVDADCDNGAALRGTPRLRGRDGGTAHRLAREAREEAKSLLPPSGGPTQVGTTPSLAFRAMIGADGGEVEMVVAL